MTKMEEVEVPTIRRLTIERFRGIERIDWRPGPGVNVILGGGDVGKSTILDAIALLLSPNNTTAVSDADYWQRDTEQGFSIEAVLALPVACGINQQQKNAWPWEWDGQEPRLPLLESDSIIANPVYRVRVRATADFELVYEIIQPNEELDSFSVMVRRQIGIVRLGGDDRNDRDLRLIQGSALDRLVSDSALKARLGRALASAEIHGQIKADAKARLENLDATFSRRSLPSGLQLGLTGGQGMSINAMIGLTAYKAGVQLPVASWGAGTRRLAALEIAAAHQGENPITLIDEIERGLEPYRQRRLVADILARRSQVMLTTHSATALSAAEGAAVWYLDSKGAIGRLADSTASHRRRDPEAFLSRFTVVVEGQTEVGFVTALLERALPNSLLDHGIWVTDGVGNPATLQLLQALSATGLAFGGFADNEGTSPDAWLSVKEKLGDLLFRWPTGCTEENIIRLVDRVDLERFIEDPGDDLTGERLRTLADRLGIESKSFADISAGSTDLPGLIIAAATGRIPDDKKNAPKGVVKTLRKHAERWFKSEAGGRELANKIFALGVWPKVEDQLLRFLNAIRRASELESIASL